MIKRTRAMLCQFNVSIMGWGGWGGGYKEQDYGPTLPR